MFRKRDSSPAATQAPSAPEPANHYEDTYILTQNLERDIIEFLSAKYTANATLNVDEIMRLYNCPRGRAQRVIANLVRDAVLVSVGSGTFKVNV